MKPLRILLLICLGALALRLFALQFVQHPGIADPNHYYNLGHFLLDGMGFNIDYIWQYNNPPNALLHPDDYWMPLTGAMAAGSMTVFGRTVQGAVALFIVLGTLVPVIGYWAGRQFRLSQGTSLFCAAACAALPEFVLNSVRTDTTIPNLLLLCGATLLLTRGLRKGGILPFVVAGVCGGVAYLVRSDSSLLLPMLVVLILCYALWGRDLSPVRHWRYAVLVPLIGIAITVPWLLRNIEVSGTPTTPRLSDMFYLTDYREHFVYDTPLTLETYLSTLSPGQIIAKRLFEIAASVKLMYTTLDVFLPVAAAGGLILVLAARDREKLLTLAPALILLLGIFVMYTILVPFKSQGGSFKKAYLTLIPLLLPLAGYALERALSDVRLRTGAMVLTVGFMAANAIELVRADQRAISAYQTAVQSMLDTANALSDTNGDGDIVLMTQDPFMLRYLGTQSVMVPMEDRDTVLEVAQRYGVDYLLMPADRPSLDALYSGAETDDRFVPAVRVPGTGSVLYGFDFEN